MDVKHIVDRSDPLPPADKMDLTLKVNGVLHHLKVAAATRLVDILREDLRLTGTKISCEIGRCGACAVQMNGELVNSCLVMAYQANHSSIQTIEGVRGDEAFHPIQQAFLEEGGFQCGYCTPGMIIAVKALLTENPHPSAEQIQEALSGNLCRCTGYGGIIRAVEKAITSLQEKQTNNSTPSSITQVNQMEKEGFVATFGSVFEHSSWVAEETWGRLPFKSREELLQIMRTVVETAEESLQLKLLRAHPDLGSRLKMSEVSKKEQAGAGLDQLSKEEFFQFSSLNKRYVEKFGFPFIMAVKGQNKETILAAIKERVEEPYEAEWTRALNEVYKIAGFRLEDLIH